MTKTLQLDLPLKNLIRKSENTDSPSKAIFFLHGFGSNMQDLFGLCPFFDKSWTCISLQASIPVQYNGWAWAELNFENIGNLPKPEQIRNHQKSVIESIKKSIQKLDLDPKRINILGFSQGASLSLYSGLLNASVFRTVVALSGFLPVKERINDFDPKKVINLDVFMGHGKLDAVVPVQLGQNTLAGLKELGLKPTYIEYNAEHTIPNECLQDVLKWLSDKNKSKEV